MAQEPKIPTKIPESDQEVFLVIARDGQILDLRVVGDGFLGSLLKHASKRDDTPITEMPVNPLAQSPGYRSYALSSDYDEGAVIDTAGYAKNLQGLKLAMNLITAEEFQDLERILDDLGPAEPGDIVQFYGCF